MDKHENSKDDDIMIMMITMIMIFYLFILFYCEYLWWMCIQNSLLIFMSLQFGMIYQDLSPNLRWMMKLDPVHKENNLQFCY